MDFQISQADDIAIASLTGRLTFQENADFRDFIRQLQQVTGTLVVDLVGLDFIDSAGLGMLLVLREGRETTVRLCTGPGQVSRLLELARFSDFFAFDEPCFAVEGSCNAQL